MSSTFDPFAAVSERRRRGRNRALAALGREVGECSGGAAGAIALLLADPGARAVLGADASSTVLVLTEGVTDPVAYARIVGESGRV